MKRILSLIPLLAIMVCAATPRASDRELGSPDLAMQAFVPPIIFAGGGDTIYISDRTANVGNAAVAGSVNRYYISNTIPVDVSSAVVVGERDVPALAMGQYDTSTELPFKIPVGFSHGPHYLAACVDDDDQINESNEENNCTSSKSGNDQMLFDSGAVVPMGVASPDQIQ